MMTQRSGRSKRHEWLSIDKDQSTIQRLQSDNHRRLLIAHIAATLATGVTPEYAMCRENVGPGEKDVRVWGAARHHLAAGHVVY